MQEKDKMIKDVMKPQELERLRRKYNSVRNEEFTPIENFTNEPRDGNYIILGGKRIPMEAYGEIELMMEEVE